MLVLQAICEYAWTSAESYRLSFYDSLYVALSLKTSFRMVLSTPIPVHRRGRIMLYAFLCPGDLFQTQPKGGLRVSDQVISPS